MPYNPSSDFVGLWRAISGNVEKAQMPGLDFVVQALARAGLLKVWTSATAPITDQTTTAWFRPASPTFASEGTLFLWDKTLNMYVPATPELFLAMLGGTTGTGGGSGGGIPEAPNDGVQYGRQSMAWTPVAGSAVIPPGSGGVDEMAIISPTPPPSPTVGQQWWDGHAMHVWDGTAWQLVGAGGAAATTSGVFAIVQTANLSIAPSSGSSFTETPWVGTPTIDTMAGYDPVTKMWKPNKAGVYLVFIMGFGPNTASAYAQAVLKNDQGVFNWSTPVQTTCIYDAFGAPAGGGIYNAAGVVQMNGTTDYLRHWSYSGTGTIYLPTTATPVWAVFAMP